MDIVLETLNVKMIFSEHYLFCISSSGLNLIFKWSVRSGDNNATLSKSMALDMATYGRPLVNGLFFDGSYTIPYHYARSCSVIYDF